jgi:SAM-dependent methyltransferase
MDTSATCPRCFGRLSPAPPCPSCGLEFELDGGVLDVLGSRARAAPAAEVEGFYAQSPFPGYAASDDAATLLDRSRRSPFLRALDAALPADARVLDCGSGTAQLAAFLALSAPKRSVFALDGCRASLACAAGFRARVRIPNLALVRADLFDLPVCERGFEYVLSRGVVHHTSDPDEAIRRVAACVAPGGTLVLGFYESWARRFHVARRTLSRLAGRPLALLDPVLRARDLDPEKRRIWIEDQYHHPLERLLPLPRVLGVLAELGFHWVRSVPPMIPARAMAGMFQATPQPGALARATLRAGWLLRGARDPDAGLVCLIVRRARGDAPGPSARGGAP